MVNSIMTDDCHDQGDAEWIVIRGSYGVITIHTSGSRPTANLSATQAYLVV
jgi:hypothetical protein